MRREDFEARGRTISLFEGVEGWFDRITEYARQKGVRLEHVLVSSGNAEIFAGTPIAPKFAHVYASKFMFDENGVAVWPALAMNYTTKTQYLFRINKGAHDLSDNGAVNKYVLKKDRPVPFENMIFIGDGSTDIPCFRLVKEQGGLSIAVYKPRAKGAQGKAEGYSEDGRVHYKLERTVGIEGDISEADRAKLMEIANKCPIHRILEGVIEVQTAQAEPGVAA